MANNLGLYDPLFYAQEALIQLEKALGMASRVHRGYEKSPQEKGSTINIRRPGTFTAQAMPISAVNTSDINPDAVAITLDQWHGVQFKVTDKELAYTTEQIIDEHIRPAVVAVADKIDLSLNGLYKYIPWRYTAANPGAFTDFTGVRQILFDMKARMDDLHLEINGERENDYLSLSLFHEADKRGDQAGRLRGELGTVVGFEVFANQNVQTHTAGSLADAAGAVNLLAGYAAGTTTMAIDGVTAAGTLAVGDTFTITGHTAPDGTPQKYVVTEAETANGSGEFASVTFAPKLVAAVVDNQVVTFDVTTGKAQNLAFHRHAFALAMAPLPELGDGMGARISSVSDPITQLALRATLWYDAINANVYVRIDALWGVKVLNENLAVRLES
jgi:hypothetical protein